MGNRLRSAVEMRLGRTGARAKLRLKLSRCSVAMRSSRWFWPRFSGGHAL